MAESTLTAAPSRPFLAGAARSPTVWRLGALVLAAAAWEFVARTGILFSGVFPPLESIATALFAALGERETYYHLGVTGLEVASGFVIGTGLGVVAGVLLGASARVGNAAEPIVEAFAAAPKVIFLPIAMLAFGIGLASKAAIGALSCFFLVALGVAAGVRGVPAILTRVGRSFGLRPVQMLFKIYLPAITPAFVTAMRLGLGLTIVGVLLSEMKLSNAGIGYLAIDHYNQFRMADMYATLVVIFAVAIFVNTIIGSLARLR